MVVNIKLKVCTTKIIALNLIPEDHLFNCKSSDDHHLIFFQVYTNAVRIGAFETQPVYSFHLCFPNWCIENIKTSGLKYLQ